MVVVTFVGAVAVVTSRALPQVSGTLAVPGLEASVAGNPFDFHYGDLIDDWLAADAAALDDARGVAEHALTTLTLEPGGG